METHSCRWVGYLCSSDFGPLLSHGHRTDMPRRAGRPHTVPLAAGDSRAEAYLHQNEQGGPCDFDMSGAGLRGLRLTACQWPAVCGQEMPGCACVE